MRPLANIFGGPERSALDLPVAGLAALAVAFAAFTIPDALLGRAIEATGLPAILSAAQPPLGTTARLLLALSGALSAFAVTFALLRWLDRFASRPPALVLDEAAPAPAVPRIRKADAHPDAPPCRPISAARDLGEPAPPSRPVAPAQTIAEAAAAPVVQPPLAAAPSASLTDLMARLERGLAKREGAEPVRPSRPDMPPPAPSNDRLQSAIEGLRALSARA
ncbi:hypothetical protein [Sphingosinicella sp.]|uniref:hypothetical protein n=1 Tax=Sphingosinicella sp. TaxID=1917971 RepID=UPI00403772B2